MGGIQETNLVADTVRALEALEFSPDFVDSRAKRIETWFNRILPMEPVSQ